MYDPFFTIEGHVRVDYFTAFIEDANRQWAVCALETPAANRGNIAISNPQEPRSEYIPFCSLRASPYLQFRKLSQVLNDKNVRLKDVSVQVLVQQLLYQVGTLRPEDDLSLFPLWKTDILRGDGVGDLVSDVELLLSELRERPRDHEQLPLIIDVLNYLSHFDSTDHSRRVRELCVNIVREWVAKKIGQIDASLEKTEDGVMDKVRSLRADCSELYMYAVLVFGGTFKLSSAELQLLVELNVLAFQGRVYASFASDPLRFNDLVLRVQRVMSERVEGAVLEVQRDLGILSRAVRRVLSHLPSDAVEWNRRSVESYCSGCFEFVSNDRHLYTVNVLTGMVLYDGNPPQSLPLTVLEHALFRRTMGNIDFEVTADATGTLRTNQPLGGYSFSFRLFDDNTQLEILEYPAGDAANSSPLELIGYDNPALSQLPIRLRELHSHWVNRDSRTLAIRGINFMQRSMSFLATLGDNSCEFTC